MIHSRRRAAAASLAGALLVACSSTVTGTGTRLDGTPQPSPPPPSAAAECPSTYRAPDPNRPVVRLGFTVSPDLATVTGTEHVEFVPDLPVTELVFRLTANTTTSVELGNKIVVTSAKADNGAGAATYTADGAAPGTQGGLLHIPFGRSVPAGTKITADIEFTVTLGALRAPFEFERYGSRVHEGKNYAWFATAHPLLAWERGVGWHTEPMLNIVGESATSEAMQTELTVVAPEKLTVLMSGDATAGQPANGNRTWRSTIEAARDVSVAVGPFVVRDVTSGGVKMRVGAYDDRRLQEQTEQMEKAIADLTPLLGPYPYESLSVARLPMQRGGIEYPSSILMMSSAQLVSTHELAHQWFYGMVGNSQATDPWLDEAFATWAEQVANKTPSTSPLNTPGDVGTPAFEYSEDEGGRYSDLTYSKGAAALHTAREAVGAEAFDRAIRCYVNANAWQIASPADLEASLRHLPKAVEILRKAGALK